MTVIAIGVHTDHAIVLADSLGSSMSAANLALTSKVHPFLHLNMVVTARGGGAIAAAWTRLAGDISEVVGTFDDFVDEAARHAPSLVESTEQALAAKNSARGTTFTATPSTCYAVGYSHQQSRYRVVGFSTPDGLLADVEDTLVAPSPFDVAPSALEEARVRELFAQIGDSENLLTAWTARPQLQVEDSLQGWLALITRVFEHRAVIPAGTYLKSLMGGPIVATTLRPGQILQQQVATLPSDGSRFAQMMQGTVHPYGQVAPCECGSGSPYAECHLAQHADELCPCGSGYSLAACCLLPAEDREAWAARLAALQ